MVSKSNKGGNAYPKWVWTPLGGWNPTPIRSKRNAVITAGFLLTLTAIVFKTSANNEVTSTN